MSYLDIVAGQLPVDEGSKSHPYRDSVGILTIGVGRNLESVGLRADEIAILLRNDIAQADKDAQSLIPTFQRLSDQRKAVLVNMCFMGIGRLKGFVKMLAAMEAEDWDTAASELLDSTYHRQVGERAERLAQQLRENHFV